MGDPFSTIYHFDIKFIYIFKIIRMMNNLLYGMDSSPTPWLIIFNAIQSIRVFYYLDSLLKYELIK